MEWALAGSATMSACLFTNPMEVIKTRMQVQGEMQRRASLAGGSAPPKLYRNFFQAFWLVSTKEGLKGIQAGLGLAALYQLMMNGTRLGLYEPIKRNIARLIPMGDPNSNAPIFTHNLLAAATSGCIAAFVGSPLFMVKVRMQVQNKTLMQTMQQQMGTIKGSPASSAASAASVAAISATPSPLSSSSPSAPSTVVGTQHGYTSSWSAFKSIYHADGVPGLFRGASASMLRVCTGSVSQLTTYDWLKHWVKKTTQWQDGLKLHFSASLLSGFCVTVAMNPADVISTRLYNQPVVNGKGTSYNGIVDCAVKTIKTEGVRGLYKGFTAHYMRLGPHTILTFVFWEQFKAMAARRGL